MGTPQLDDLEWRKASPSNDTGSACVEIAVLDSDRD
ncbi:uncharacterized protein DUF397 [Actinoallomurus bryophytorum]|uniref:Uncharacterized protein DUF397 n=1 Tax=Actinoallomurus bryophytorum TaxID=1490222 RepID=A0A543CTH5_9ACTN|nr:uncharacterized protein DUF397 [Actinoallomurus bryophytorum]